MPVDKKYLKALGWSIYHDRLAGMYRGIRNGAATDNDVTVYCQTEAEAWEEIEGNQNEENAKTGYS